MSANRPKQQEIGKKPDIEEQEKGVRKGDPGQRGKHQGGEDRQDTPNYRNQSGERKNR